MTSSTRTPTVLLTTLLATLVTGALGLAALVAPASAASYPASASAGPGVLYAECTGHPVSYTVSPPADNITWNLRLTYQAPDGTAAGSEYINKGEPLTGVVMEQFCADSNIPGTYTVTGTFEVTQRVGTTRVETVRTEITPFTFDLRLAAVKATAKAMVKKAAIGKKVGVLVKVLDERPSGGFFPTSGAEVVLQRLKGSRWVGVPGAKGWTDGSGKVKLKYKHTWKKAKLRAVADTSYLGQAITRPVTVRGR